MNKEYFDIIMKRIKDFPFERFDTNLTSYNSDIDRIGVKLFQNVKITIRHESDMLKIEIENRFKRIEGKILYPMKLAFLSSSYWKWRKLAKRIEKEHKKRIKNDIKEAEKIKKLEMDRTMTEMFPEIYENDLLGDDHDK